MKRTIMTLFAVCALGLASLAFAPSTTLAGGGSGTGGGSGGPQPAEGSSGD